jgi:hypothetical protein
LSTPPDIAIAGLQQHISLFCRCTKYMPIIKLAYQKLSVIKRAGAHLAHVLAPLVLHFGLFRRLLALHLASGATLRQRLPPPLLCYGTTCTRGTKVASVRGHPCAYILRCMYFKVYTFRAISSALEGSARDAVCCQRICARSSLSSPIPCRKVSRVCVVQESQSSTSCAKCTCQSCKCFLMMLQLC